MAALPIIAVLMCFIIDISPEFKIGIIILSSTPGGTTAGFISFLLKADVALSISLTAINSFLALFTIPLIVSFGFTLFMNSTTSIELPIMHTILQIVFIVIIPTCIGVAVRHKYLSFATNTEKIVKVFLLILLPALFFIKFFASEEYGGVNIQKSDYQTLFPITIIFNLICIILGYLFILINKLNHKTRLTTSIETSVHNTPLALLIAGTILNNQEMVKPIMIYTIFSFWTPIIFGVIVNKILNRTQTN
jgi:BASS family bile acid:Na+ symporter